jgi:hypothetical protein
LVNDAGYLNWYPLLLWRVFPVFASRLNDEYLGAAPASLKEKLKLRMNIKYIKYFIELDFIKKN